MINKRIKFVRYSATVFVALLLTSCTSAQFGDLFSGYSQQMRQVNLSQRQGDFVAAQTQIPYRHASDGTYTLSLLEKGRLQFLAKDWPASQQTFTLAYQRIQSEQQKAKIQLSRGVEKVAAVISNDNALRYDIHAYEQSMLHSYQALNYLYQHQLEGALVEVRRANLVQVTALKDNKNSLYEAQEKMASNGISANTLQSQYPSMGNIIGDVKNGFQNAYTFYLSALLYEAAGESNDAYIDYKKALEIYPENHYLQQDVLRLAHNLAMVGSDKNLDKALEQYQAMPAKNGEIVVIFEQGIIPSKQQIKLNLPLYSHSHGTRFFSFALPTYRAPSHNNNLKVNNRLSLRYGEQQFTSQDVVRLQSLAGKTLQDDMPAIVTRQIIRLLAKEEIRQQMTKSGGDLGNIFASIYNIASEKADTRSWMTLPNTVQILRLNVPAGKQQIELNVAGQRQTMTLSIVPKGITMIYVTATGNKITYQQTDLK